LGILLKKYSCVVHLFFIFLGTYFIAKIVSTMVASKIRIDQNTEVNASVSSAPEAKKVASFDDYKVVIERNIFDSHEQAPAPAATPEAAEINPNAPAVKTTLPIKLVSTFVMGEGTDKRSTATVTGGGAGAAASEIYTVDDTKSFAPGVKITKIMRDRIEFINGSRLEFAEIEQFGGSVNTSAPTSSGDKPPTPAGPPTAGIQQLDQSKFVFDKAQLDNALGNLDQLFTQIRAVPNIGPGGKSAGLKLLSIRGDSLFAKLGLKRNDVLERINGQDVDMKRGLEIFGQLKDSNHISIDLERDGKKTTLEYDIQ